MQDLLALVFRKTEKTEKIGGKIMLQGKALYLTDLYGTAQWQHLVLPHSLRPRQDSSLLSIPLFERPLTAKQYSLIQRTCTRLSGNRQCAQRMLCLQDNSIAYRGFEVYIGRIESTCEIYSARHSSKFVTYVFLTEHSHA